MIKTYFRLALTLSWFSLFIGLVVDIFTEDSLPPLLLEFIRIQDESFQFTPDMIIILIILIVVFISSYIGLYLWKNWGRILLLVFLIFGYVLTPFYTEPTVSSVWADDIYSISYILIGIVIGMMCFSEEISERFKKPNIKQN